MEAGVEGEGGREGGEWERPRRDRANTRWRWTRDGQEAPGPGMGDDVEELMMSVRIGENGWPWCGMDGRRVWGYELYMVHR